MTKAKSLPRLEISAGNPLNQPAGSVTLHLNRSLVLVNPQAEQEVEPQVVVVALNLVLFLWMPVVEAKLEKDP